MQGKVALHVKSDAKTHLTGEEESKLVEFIAGCASVGYAKSHKEVQAIAKQIAACRNPQVQLTKGWWDPFKGRHPEVTLQQAEPLSYARAVATDPAIITKYFDVLEDTLSTSGLVDKPGQIFNCDETGLPLQCNPPKIVALTTPPLRLARKHR